MAPDLDLLTRKLLHVAGDEDVGQGCEDVGVSLCVGVAAQSIGGSRSDMSPPQALLHRRHAVLKEGIYGGAMPMQ